MDNDGVWGGSTTTVLGRTGDTVSSTSYVEQGSNLDLTVELYDSAGNLVTRVNDAGLAAHVAVQGLGAGTYYLKIDGVGFGDPTSSTPTGYTDYASIGNYWISGTIGGAVNPVPVPAISVAVSSNRVIEDSAGTLVYTFTRSIVTDSALTVNFSVGGTAANGSDYSGLPAAGSAQTVNFAANAATATVVLLPIADAVVEPDVSVVLSLAAGAGYNLASTSSLTSMIVNDDGLPAVIALTSVADSLVSTLAADTFRLNQLRDSLLSLNPDKIVGLQIGFDTIDIPAAGSIKPKLLGSVAALDAAAISKLLSNKNFGKNNAAVFSFSDASGVRTFLAINDGIGGFNQSTDSVIEITGYKGSLSTLILY